MNRKNFIALLSGITILSPKVWANTGGMEIHFWRHATFLLKAGDVTLLVDPMLCVKDAMDPIANAKNVVRIPMVELPVDEAKLKKELKSIDGVLITHTHRDHWDTKAQEMVDKKIPLICQPPDVAKLNEQGFTNLVAVNTSAEFKGLKITRTDGQHGTGEIGARMGHVSGFVIEYQQKKIYIAGDTIWCDEVEQALAAHKPDYIIVNAGSAQFEQGDPITMNAEDVMKTINKAPYASVIAVHMDTINHCWLTRTLFTKDLKANNLLSRCRIPEDGDKIVLS